MEMDVGGRVVDLGRIEVRFGGEVIPVQPKVFALIEYLLTHRDRVVSKAELLDNVWGDRFVSEAALTTRIKAARRALGDDGRRQEVIKTVHGRGYRLVADVSLVPTAATRTPSASTTIDRRPEEPDDAGGAVVPVDGWPFVGRFDALERVRRIVGTGTEPATVAIVGPRGAGRSRLLAELERALGRDGVAVRWVRGGGSTRSVPLAALAPLLPSEVISTTQVDPELARGELFRRAYDHLAAAVGPSEVLVVDDAHLLDELSQGVLAALVTASPIGIVVSQRTPRRGSAEVVIGHDADDVVTLGPLSDTDLDVILYRVLPGPIEDESVRRLAAACRGRPGVLRDIVDSSQETGALVRVDGAWRLTADPTSSRSAAWPPEGLDERTIDGAQRLSLLPPVPVDVVVELLGDAVVDDLDAAGLLALDESAERITLADPLLAGRVVGSISPIRRRRLERELAEAFGDLPADPRVAARVVRWSEGSGVDASSILRLAWTTLLGGDIDAAESLVEIVDADAEPSALALLAEVAHCRRQWALAAERWAAVRVDEVDDLVAALTLRRRSVLGFDRHGDLGHMDRLAQDAAGRSAFVRQAVDTRRICLLALDGRHDEVIEGLEAIDRSTGVVDLELVLAAAVTRVGRLELDEALRTVDQAETMLDAVPAVWRASVRDTVMNVRCAALLHRGEIGAAADIARTELPLGRRTTLGVLPALAAEIELNAGRPRMAREMLRSSVATSWRTSFPQYVILCETRDARAAHELDPDLDLGPSVGAAEAALRTSSGLVRRQLVITWADLLWRSGRREEAIDALLEEASLAHEAGDLLAEAELLTTAAAADPTPGVARRVVERVAQLAGPVAGRLWALRAEEVRLRASGDVLDEVARRYEELGYRGRADRCRADGAESLSALTH